MADAILESGLLVVGCATKTGRLKENENVL
jgi:hypothetical protein